MNEPMPNGRLAWLVTGILIGLAVGSVLPSTPLHAMATHGQEGFVIATGEVDPSLEAVYFLDSLTGDLKGAVLNITTRRFTTFYQYNVLKDLGVDGIKSPKFLMVTGIADVRQGAMRTRLGRAAIYVAEVNSGQIAVYGVRWDTARAITGQLITTDFVLLDVMKFRTTAIRR